MTRDVPRNRGAIVRRLQAVLDERAADFSVTPAFSARVQRLRRRRRIVRQTTQAVVLAAVVVVLAVTAVNALRPADRIDFVSPIATPSPSPAETDDAAQPSPPPSEPPSETPSETPSESEEPSEAPTASEEPPPAAKTEAPPEERLTADTPIDLYGIGPIEAGMTLGEAERAAGVDLVPTGFDDFEGRCYYAYAEGLREDFSFLVTAPLSGGERVPLDRPEDGIIRRVSATKYDESPAQTLSGVAIGDTEEEVYDTYAGQITSEPHVYVEGGHYLTYTPRNPADQDYKVVFFTDGSVVEEIHAGDVGYAGAVEGGCV
jgi:hypothetical protein